MEILRKICFTEMESIFGLMDLNTLDSFHLIKNMEKVCMSGVMVVNFKVDGIEDLDKGKEFIHFKMVTKEKVYGGLINESNGLIDFTFIYIFYFYHLHLLLLLKLTKY